MRLILNRLNFQLGTEFNWPTNCMAYVYKNFKSDPYWIFGSNTRIPKKLRCANASCHMFPCFHAMNESDSQIWTFRVPKRSSRNVLTRSTRWSLMYSRKLRNPTRNVVGTISWGVRWKYALKMLKPDSNSVATNKHEPLPWFYTDSFFLTLLSCKKWCCLLQSSNRTRPPQCYHPLGYPSLQPQTTS